MELVERWRVGNSICACGARQERLIIDFAAKGHHSNNKNGWGSAETVSASRFVVAGSWDSVLRRVPG